MEQILLHTERLLLKSLTPSIIHYVFHTKSKDEIIANLGTNEQGYLHYKEMHEMGMETHRISMFLFLLIDKQSNTPIGECGFHTWNKTHRRAEVFYNIYSENMKQKGYMKEALHTVLEFGFSQLNLHRIQALIDDNNTPSKKLLLHFGFVKEGTLREDYVVNNTSEDSDCYSLLQHEWC